MKYNRNFPKTPTFNALTVCAAIIFGVQGISSHNIYLRIFNCLGMVVLLVALHVELRGVYGNKSRFVSPILFLIVVSLYVVDPLSSIEQSESRRQIRALQDSLVVYHDSITTYRYLLALGETSKVNSNQRLELAQRYFTSQNAPSIGVVRMAPTVEVGKRISMDITFRNSGRTAKGVIFWGWIVWHTVPYTEFVLYNDTKETVQDFAQEEAKLLHLARADTLTKELYEGMVGGDIYLYCYGRLDYTDEHNNPYRRDFCEVFDKDIKEFRDLSNYRFIYEKKHTKH